MEIKGGYYIKARKIQDSAIAHAPPCVREIWDWLLKEANHKEVIYMGQVIKRGQTIRSYKDIIEGLHWTVGWRKMYYSKSDCETAMKWLKKHTMIHATKTTRGMIITVIKYDLYQDPDNYENHRNNTTKTTSKPQTSDTINKNEKNEKKETLVAKATVDLGKFPKADYSIITESYKKIKGVEPKGKEWLPILKEIKLMFQSGRTPTQIVKAMEVCNSLYDDWAMSTIRMKIADVVSGKLGVKTKQGESSLEIKSIKQR